MPVMVSTKCTIDRAEDTRDRRYASSDRTWYQRVTIATGTAAPSSTRNDGGSSSRMDAAVNDMNISPDTSEDTPWSSSSRSASRSEVCREITRPDVYRSWNPRLSRCVCRNTRSRRLSSMAWLARAVSHVYAPRRPPEMRAAATYAPPTGTRTGQTDSPARTASTTRGSSASIAQAMISGPAARAALDTSTKTTVSSNVPRTGRASSPSRRKDRRRMWRRSARV